MVKLYPGVKYKEKMTLETLTNMNLESEINFETYNVLCNDLYSFPFDL